MKRPIFERLRRLQRTPSGLHVPLGAQLELEANLGPLTPEQHVIQLEGLKQFEDHPEIQRIWEFDPTRGMLPSLTFEPGASRLSKTDYWIVTPFVAGMLTLHSRDALRAGKFTLHWRHAVLFDSNLFHGIVQFVEDDRRLNRAKRRSVQAFLEALIARRYDFNWLPYLVESFAKNDRATAERFARRAAGAMLRLHVMDAPYFRATGSIKMDHAALESYGKDFGTTGFDEIIDVQLADMAELGQTPPEVNLNLACLLKLVQIRHFDHRSGTFDARWAAFDEFLFDRLGVYAGTMRAVIAPRYLLGRLDLWMSVQRLSDFDRALSQLRNCAWDLYLATLPQGVLAQSPEDLATICHFCTHEAELAKIAGASLVRMIRVSSDGGILPYLEFDLETLSDIIGKDWHKSLELANERALTFSKKRDSGVIARMSADAIPTILDEAVTDFRRSMIRT